MRVLGRENRVKNGLNFREDTELQTVPRQQEKLRLGAGSKNSSLVLEETWSDLA